MVRSNESAQNKCAYCQKCSEGLEKLRNTNKLRMMQRNDPEYNRDSLFCRICRPRIEAKYQHEKANRRTLANVSSASSEKTGSYSFIPSLDNRSNASTNSSAAGPSHQQPAGPAAGNRSSTSAGSSSASVNANASSSLEDDSGRHVGRRPKRTSHDPSSDDANRGDTSSRASADNGNRSGTSNTSGRNRTSPKKPRRTTSPVDFDHGTASDSNRSSRQSASASNSQESGQNQQAYDYAEVEVDVHVDRNDVPNVSVLVPMPKNRPMRQPPPTRPPTPERMASMSSSERSSMSYQRPNGG